MNTKKISWLPINLILCLPTFFFAFIVIEQFTNQQTPALFISLLIYIKDAIQSATNDYLQEEINELKGK